MPRFRPNYAKVRHIEVPHHVRMQKKEPDKFVMKDKNKKHLIPGYTESVLRKQAQSNQNNRLRGKPVTLPTLSIQED